MFHIGQFESPKQKIQRTNSKIALLQSEIQRIYCYPELLSKSGKHIVSIESLIQKSGSFSGTVKITQNC